MTELAELAEFDNVTDVIGEPLPEPGQGVT
jgi:hypothetical protein